jgi:hypothetical protein
MKPNAFKAPASPADPLVVTEREAARRLGISPRTMWTMRNAGQVPFIKIRGAVRYAVTDLIELIERNRQSAE